MTDFKLYEISAYRMDYPEYLTRFKLVIEGDEYNLSEKELNRLRSVLLEKFPITEAETREFDKRRAIKLVEEETG